MAEIFGFFHRRQGVQIFFIEPAISLKRIDREIANPERRQILEEMRSLARIDTIVLQPAFHNDAGIADMRPFHRNAQPGIAAAPTAGTDQDIVLFLCGEPAVHLLDVVSYQLVVGRVESTGLHIYDILHIRHDAMS